MTKINVTKRELVNIHRELNFWKGKGSVLAYFMDSKIKEFYNHNRLRIETVIADLNTLNRMYFVHEINAQGQDAVKMHEGKRVEIEGMKTEDYEKELEKLMSSETVMEI